MTYGRRLREGPIIRHHVLTAAGVASVKGPVNKGNGRSNTSKKGHGRGNAVTAEAFLNDNYYNVAALLDADGQADGTSYTDESRHAHAVTFGGNADITSDEFTFDGTGDYLQVGGAARGFWIPGSQCTIELRNVKFSSTASGQVLVSAYKANSGDRGWMISYSGTALEFTVSEDGIATTSASYTWTPATDGTAYDISASWDGAKLRLYVDGDYVAGTAFTGEIRATARILYIGCNDAAGSPANFFNGTMRAVRFTKGIARVKGETTIALPTLPWSTSETSSYTDGSWADVLLLLTAADDGSIYDASPYDWRISVNGDSAVTTSVEPFADANSVTFDGTGDYLSIHDDPLLELGSSDLTIELFARHTSTSGTQSYVTKYQTTTNRSWGLDWEGGSGVQRWLTSSSGSSIAANLQDSWSPSTATWYHVAQCRSGSNNRKFVDGSQIGTTQTDSTNFYDGTSILRIGAIYSSGLTNYMNGHITEARITKSARYTAGFTAPSAVFDRG